MHSEAEARGKQEEGKRGKRRGTGPPGLERQALPGGAGLWEGGVETRNPVTPHHSHLPVRTKTGTAVTVRAATPALLTWAMP